MVGMEGGERTEVSACRLSSRLESSDPAGDGPALVRAGGCSHGRHHSASGSKASFQLCVHLAQTTALTGGGGSP